MEFREPELTPANHPIRFANSLLPRVENPSVLSALVQLVLSVEHYPLLSLLQECSSDFISSPSLEDYVGSVDHFLKDPFMRLAPHVQLDDFRCLFTSSKGSMPAMEKRDGERLFPKRETVATVEEEEKPWHSNDPNVVVIRFGPTLARHRVPEKKGRVNRWAVPQDEYKGIFGITKAALLLSRPLHTFLMLYLRAQLDDVDQGLGEDHPLRTSIDSSSGQADAFQRQVQLMLSMIKIQDQRATEDFTTVAKVSDRWFKVSALEVYLDVEVPDAEEYMARVRRSFIEIFRRARKINSKAIEGAEGLSCQMGSSTLVKLYIRPDRKIRFEVVFFEDHPLNVELKRSWRTLTAREGRALIMTAFAPFLRAWSRVELRAALDAPEIEVEFRDRVYEALRRSQRRTRERVLRYLLTLYRGGLVAGSRLRGGPTGAGRRQMDRIQKAGLAEPIHAGELGSCVFYRATDPWAWWSVGSGAAERVIREIAARFPDLDAASQESLGEPEPRKLQRVRYGLLKTTSRRAAEDGDAPTPDESEAA